MVHDVRFDSTFWFLVGDQFMHEAIMVPLTRLFRPGAGIRGSRIRDAECLSPERREIRIALRDAVNDRWGMRAAIAWGGYDEETRRYAEYLRGLRLTLKRVEYRKGVPVSELVLDQVEVALPIPTAAGFVVGMERPPLPHEFIKKLHSWFVYGEGVHVAA